MVTQFGINMLVPIFMCSFAGWFLDKKFGTSYWFVLLFFIGALAGGYKRSPEESAYLHEGRSKRYRSKNNEKKS